MHEAVYNAMSADDVEARTIDAVLDAIPDGWAKVDGEWVQVAQADRYDVEGPGAVIDGANVLVTLPKDEE